MMVRRARASDAASIGAVHVAAWRSAYAGILPDEYLARMSVARQAAYYDADIRGDGGVFVATSGSVVGFATAGRARRSGVAEGEVHTLYVLDDYRDQGIGRALLRASAAHLKQQGCRSAFLWVLSSNGAKWFYQRMGGRPGMEAYTSVGGVRVPQTAYVWDPIEAMLPAALP